MAERSKIVAEIIALLQPYAGKKCVITEQTRLGDDIGLFGDDAEEFMQSFFQRLQVDLGDFWFDAYFEPETERGCVLIRRSRKRLAVTVGHLIECAEAGRWLPVLP